MKFVEYDEPDGEGNDNTVRLTIEEAIRRIKRTAALHHYQYRSDQEALDDFLTVHWAHVIEVSDA